MAKLTELKSAVDAVNSQVAKAFGEIRSLIDQQSAKIEELTKQLGDADIPADAQASLDALKALAQKLDDIVPDAPPTT